MPAVFEEVKFWYGTPSFQDPIILNGQNPVLFYPVSLRNMLHYGSKLGLKSGIDILWNNNCFILTWTMTGRAECRIFKFSLLMLELLTWKYSMKVNVKVVSFIADLAEF